MEIGNTLTVNTGSHVMVDYHVVKYGGRLKVIGVSDDCVTGYGNTEPWLNDEKTRELWSLPHEHVDAKLSYSIIDHLKKHSTTWPKD